jgi:hypothetical protein
MGNGKDAFTNLESTLRDSGHGSQAVIITSDSNGRAHAWNAVNHNGDITYIDSQTGQRSNTPLHNGDNGVFAIPLNPDRRPVTPTTPGPAAGSNRPADSRPATTERRPDATPAGNGSKRKRDDESSDDDGDDGDVSMADTNADADDDRGEGPSTKRPRRDDGNDPSMHAPTQGMANLGLGSDSDHATPATPHNADAHPLPPAERPTDHHKGLPPDQSQASLRTPGQDGAPESGRNPVHRIDLEDNVHDNLRRWANDGKLATVLSNAGTRVEAARAARAAGLPEPPTRFTHDELENALGDNFRNMNAGERGAVVATIARLSLGFHEGEGVGGSPRHDTEGKPYKDSPPQGEGAKQKADPATTAGRSVAAQSRDNAKKTEVPPKYRQPGSDGDTALKNLHKHVTGRSKSKLSGKDLDALIQDAGIHRPDFSAKNYAVVEVVDSDGNHTYVVDSSVPADTTGVSPRHSEKHLLDWMKRVNDTEAAGKSQNIVALYTEREPCGVGEGHANCSKRIREATSMANVPVYYSATYRQDAAGVAIRNDKRAQLKQQQAAITSDPAFQAMTKDQQDARLKQAKLSDAQIKTQVKKEGTNAEEAIVGEMDAHVEVVAETWAKVQMHLIPEKSR